MGCWNGTCGFSNLPIHVGQRVRAYLIAVPPTNSNPSGFCYSNEAGYPVGLPFKAQYNDYGGIENIDADIVTKLMSEWFGKTYTELENWINDDISADGKAVFDIHKKTREFHASDSYKKVMAEDHEKSDPIQLKAMEAYYDIKPKLGLFLVHEDIFQAMANAQPNYRNKTVMGALHLMASIQESIEKFHEIMGDKFSGDLVEKLNNDWLDPFTQATRTWIEDANDLNSNGWPKKKCYDNPLAIILGGSGYAGSAHPKETTLPFRKWILSQIINQQPIDELVPFLVDHEQVLTTAETTRRIWYPQSGRGSQRENYKSHLVVHKAAVKLAQAGYKAEQAWRISAGYEDDEDE